MNIDDMSLVDLKDEMKELEAIKKKLEQSRKALDKVESSAAEAAKSIGDLKQTAKVEGT